MNALKLLKQNPLLSLILVFLIFVIIWFSRGTMINDTGNWTPRPSIANTQAGGEFEPDGTNVSPSTQSQLESLRMRVIDAPDDTMHVFKLARLLQDSHKPEEAARNYRHYLAIHPDNYQAWLDMTQSFGQAKLWQEALEAVDDMLIKYPADPSALYNKGAVYANLGRTEEAANIWHEVMNQTANAEVAALAQNALQRLVN